MYLLINSVFPESQTFTSPNGSQGEKVLKITKMFLLESTFQEYILLLTSKILY